MIRPPLLPGVLVAVLVAAMLFLAGALVPVSYVTLTPGPTADTLGEWDDTTVVAIEGAETFPSDGKLLLTTVVVIDDRTLGDAVSGWLDPSDAVVPRDTVYPPDKTREETDQINNELFAASEDAATTAALTYLGYDTEVVVLEPAEDGPSEGKLESGDVITTVDGQPVATTTELVSAIGDLEPGTTVEIGYIRDGEEGVVDIETAAADAGPHRSVIGVVVATQSSSDVMVTVSADGIGGPSAGLMLALSIVEQLTPEDLTGGLTVAGTGEITPSGDVGTIGGVRQKVIAAGDIGADAFLLPADNCAEALKTVPDGLPLLPVETLGEAVDALELLTSEGADADGLPRCS